MEVSGRLDEGSMGKGEKEVSRGRKTSRFVLIARKFPRGTVEKEFNFQTLPMRKGGAFKKGQKTPEMV